MTHFRLAALDRIADMPNSIKDLWRREIKRELEREGGCRSCGNPLAPFRRGEPLCIPCAQMLADTEWRNGFYPD